MVLFFFCFRFVLRLELTPHGATSHTPAAPSAATQWAETSRLPLPWSLWSPLSPANQWTSRQKIRVRGKTTKRRTLPTNPSWARLLIYWFKWINYFLFYSYTNKAAIWGKKSDFFMFLFSLALEDFTLVLYQTYSLLLLLFFFCFFTFSASNVK